MGFGGGKNGENSPHTAAGGSLPPPLSAPGENAGPGAECCRGRAGFHPSRSTRGGPKKKPRGPGLSRTNPCTTMASTRSQSPAPTEAGGCGELASILILRWLQSNMRKIGMHKSVSAGPELT